MNGSRPSRVLVSALALAVVLPTIALSAPPPVRPGDRPSAPPPPPPADDNSPTRQAERLNEEGKTLSREKRYEDALAKFRLAYKVFPLSNAIFNIGSMLFTLGRFEEAYPYFTQMMNVPLSADQRRAVEDMIAKTEKAVELSHAAVQVDTEPPGCTVALKGSPPFPFMSPIRVLVPYGALDLQISRNGYKPKLAAVRSARESPPAPVKVRLERQEDELPVSVICGAGRDVFVDGEMKGFEQARNVKLTLGKHTVRCGPVPGKEAFEKYIVVKRGLANWWDFSNPD